MELLTEQHQLLDQRHEMEFERARNWYSEISGQLKISENTMQATLDLSNAAELEFNSGNINFYDYLQIKSKTIESILATLALRKDALIAQENLKYYSK